MPRQLKDKIKSFLETRKTLILDKSGVIRTSISQLLFELGQPKSAIFECSKYIDALNVIRDQQPKIIFTDYMVDYKLGFSLFQKTSEHCQNERERVYFLITANTEDYAVAEAAEEDVDAFVIKPFSKEMIERYIINTIRDKITVSPHNEELIKAKNEITNKNYDVALNHLFNALQIADSPALIYYYRGVCYQQQGLLTEAYEEFENGLAAHPKHFKCLIGKFECLYAEKKFNEAYNVIHYLAEKYPLSPERLGSVTMLAVYTKNFSDMDKYYDYYVSLDTKPERISKIVSAGMFAYAQVLFNDKKNAEGIIVLKKTITASVRSKEYLEKSVELALKMNEPKAALEFLQLYSFDDQVLPEWKSLHFKTISLLETPDRIIAKGKELISEGQLEIEIVKKVVELLIDSNRKPQAENYIYALIPKMPSHRSELVALIDKPKTTLD